MPGICAAVKATTSQPGSSRKATLKLWKSRPAAPMISTRLRLPDDDTRFLRALAYDASRPLYRRQLIILDLDEPLPDCGPDTLLDQSSSDRGRARAMRASPDQLPQVMVGLRRQQGLEPLAEGFVIHDPNPPDQRSSCASLPDTRLQILREPRRRQRHDPIESPWLLEQVCRAGNDLQPRRARELRHGAAGQLDDHRIELSPDAECRRQDAA